MLKGKDYISVTLEHPEQYFTCRKSKSIPEEMKEYVKWVTDHFDIDEPGKQIHLKKAVPSQASRPDSASYSHSNTHKREAVRGT